MLDPDYRRQWLDVDLLLLHSVSTRGSLANERRSGSDLATHAGSLEAIQRGCDSGQEANGFGSG